MNEVVMNGRRATATNPVSDVKMVNCEVYAKGAVISRGTLCWQDSVIISVPKGHWLAGLFLCLGKFITRNHG